ncbi:MAG: M23 family metallopeptidase [Treponema sp.]|nr:M23 family metallopeptidase [Treponema sp.]
MKLRAAAIVWHLVIMLALTVPLCAETAVYEDDEFSLIADYYARAYPGDAAFVRLTLKATRRSRAGQETNAVLELYRNEKKIDSARFFNSQSRARRNGQEELVAGIPLSTYLKSSDRYTLSIVYTVAGEMKTFSLPFAIIDKKFVEESIPLNETNTAIRTDTSTKRMEQIDRLNAVLGTINENTVYTLEPFITPVAADTRRSSLFGDRRIYVYSSGKTATSLHYGIDYAVPTGTVVSACGQGRVVLAENRITTGWSVVIEHAPGLYSLYYHLSSLSVEEGKLVKPGEQIGLSGATGLATGPHLHWEIRLNMAAVSPDYFTGAYIPTGN